MEAHTRDPGETMIKGELTYLTALEPENSETIRAWINDPDTHRWMLSGHIPVSMQEERAFFASTEAERADGTAYRFEIHAGDDGRLLGVCGIEHVSLLHRHGELGVFIGSRDERGKGFGGDSLRTLTRFAFDTLGFHSLRITVLGGNTRARALYGRLGFKETGTDREAWYLNGVFEDLVRLDMLESEYRSMSASPPPAATP